MIGFLVFKLIIFIFLLCILFYYFVYTTIKKLSRRRRIRTQGEKAIASVIDYKIAKDSDRVRSYFPVLQFRTKEDQIVTVHSKKARTTKYPAGHMVTVYYMRKDPTKYYIAGLIPFIKIASIILGGCGVVLLCYEIFVTIKQIVAGS